ncbi:tetratricopeptide repeat protein [Oscillatoria sp. CS-180]|uniref:tetratricopeptide repeat protein n=1 Tax=Oscillatoria sp. CS-180 TaxID=3021720 RepID=UPI00232AFFFD|nr:tetratricopeptide repeat protein [Oscillatoria sp. CS-180]MDB9525655.1 tetratricopeptide repeat protein [Oscillatoria sp. CS-180]
MEDTNLLLIYLVTLVVLLSVATVLVIRQVFKTRRVEGNLNRLQNKLSQETGTAQEYYELGSLMLDKKLYSQAVLHLKQALKLLEEEDSDKAALIYNALGFSYFAQEQYDLAIRQYKEALDIAPGYVTAWNNLGHSYERKQLTAQALESYETALNHEPENETAKRRASSLRKRFVPAGEKE